MGPYSRTSVARTSRRLLPVVGLVATACLPDFPTESGDGGSVPVNNVVLTAPQYMDSALSLMQGHSVNQGTDWPTFVARWKRAAAAESTYRGMYPLIQNALLELDPYSVMNPPDDLAGANGAPPERADLQVQSRMLNPGVGYLWVPGYTGNNPRGRIDSTHAALRTLDANNPCGWILDLRANSGGFVFALLASIGPLYSIGEPVVVGGQVYPSGYQIVWFYGRDGTNDVFGITDGRSTAELPIATPWRPKRAGLPVAVLHGTSADADGAYTTLTASAGEALTLAFRGGVPTRSFGLPTLGAASGRSSFFMPDSARLDITDSYMFDRTGYAPGDRPIPPDSTIAGPATVKIGDASDPVIAAAATWLRGRRECGGSSTEGDPAAVRMPFARPPVGATGSSSLPPLLSRY